MLLQRGLQVGHSFRQFPTLELCDAEGSLLLNLLQVRNCLFGVALGKECISEQAVCRRKTRVQLQCPFQGRDSRAVVMILHTGLAEIDKTFCEGGLKFGDSAEFRDRNLEVRLLFCLASCFKVWQRFRRERLPR